MNLTNEDKIWAGVGIAVALGGGAWWYFKSRQEAEMIPGEGHQDAATPRETLPGTTVKIPKPAPKQTAAITTVPAAQIVLPDAFCYAVGQEVMSNRRPETITQIAYKDANGEYFTKGENYTRFNYGDKIGIIIWSGFRSDDKTYRYVVKRTGNYGVISYHWLKHSDVKAVGRVLPLPSPPPPKTAAPALDYDRILKKGLYKGSNEVKELQRLLGFTGAAKDGDFGQKTEAALFTQKRVKEIALKNFK